MIWAEIWVEMTASRSDAMTPGASTASASADGGKSAKTVSKRRMDITRPY